MGFGVVVLGSWWVGCRVEGLGGRGEVQGLEGLGFRV